MEGRRDGKYLLYAHVFPSGIVYVGVTQEIGDWDEGRKYEDNEPLQAELREVGWQHVKHEVLKRELEEEEANLLKNSLISIIDGVYNEEDATPFAREALKVLDAAELLYHEFTPIPYVESKVKVWKREREIERLREVARVELKTGERTELIKKGQEERYERLLEDERRIMEMKVNMEEDVHPWVVRVAIKGRSSEA